MKISTRFGALLLAALVMVPATMSPAFAQKKSFKVLFPTYIGYQPMLYMQKSGVLKKWTDKYGITIEIAVANDYVAGMTQFTAGEIDAYATVPLDALTMAAAGGTDTVIFMTTSASDGNDQIISKTAKNVKEMEGKTVWLMQYTLGHYMVNRALQKNGMPINSVKTQNLSDADQVSAFLTRPEVEIVSSAKPMTSQMLEGVPGSVNIFDSSDTPNEVLDVIIARKSTLDASPEFGKAFTGAWFETMEALRGGGKPAEEIKAFLASSLSTDVPMIEKQLATTTIMGPTEAYTVFTEDQFKETLKEIQDFALACGLFGQSVRSPEDVVGTKFADGDVMGDAKNVKLFIDASYIGMAKDGKL
jgi:NitT/TauT family transport system substrate-binding protein